MANLNTKIRTLLRHPCTYLIRLGFTFVVLDCVLQMSVAYLCRSIADPNDIENLGVVVQYKVRVRLLMSFGSG